MAFDPLTDFFVSDGLPQDHNSRDNAGPIRVLAEPADPDFYACVDRRGNALPVHQITDGRNKGGNAFWAYWCPYDQDRLGYTVLTGGADVMFTATMDGCSFGIGHAGPDGSVIVGHVNSTRLQDPSGDTGLMEKDQRKQLKLLSTRGRFGWKGPTIYEPRNYRYRNGVREVSASTFGVRENGKWRFYAHRWVKGYQGFQVVYQYLGLKRIR